MLTKNKTKYIQSLKNKKYRDLHDTFVVEGIKMNLELIKILRAEYIIATREVLEMLPDKYDCENIIEITESELHKLSFQKTPQNIIGVYHKKKLPCLPNPDKNLILALDDIQDPGNLGTLARLADWYGITDLICSRNTVDIYNPKTIQSTMGAIGRVNVHYCELKDYLTEHQNTPIYGTFLEGSNIYKEDLTTNGIIIMGNEGQGISREIEKLVSKKLYIPPYPLNANTSESLNVSIAAAIVCSEFRRRLL